jgi:hypothetical protein
MQIQMALASLMIIGAFAVVNDFPVLIEYGLWHGFDSRACFAVISSAIGGLIVSAGDGATDDRPSRYPPGCSFLSSSGAPRLSSALTKSPPNAPGCHRAAPDRHPASPPQRLLPAVLKYADSVLKGYATSASVILTGLLSSFLFGTAIDLHFILAVINVTCSIALYSNLGKPTSTSSALPTAERRKIGIGDHASPSLRPTDVAEPLLPARERSPTRCPATARHNV